MTTPVAVLGAGVLGLDLIERIRRSPHLDCQLVVGHHRASTGLRRAAAAGCITETGGPAVLARYAADLEVVFDASDAATHVHLVDLLQGTGVRVIDLTPGNTGRPVVPSVNAADAAAATDISLISCAGQATIPVLHALAAHRTPDYIEIVTTAASATAGPATRRNLDEFLACTGAAIAAFTGADTVKVLANISPARPAPPFRVVMRVRAAGLDPEQVPVIVERAARPVRDGVPGYTVTACTLDGDVLTVTVQVTSTGPWIPAHAGNLEIISAAAVAVAESVTACGITSTASPGRDETTGPGGGRRPRAGSVS
jgi:acetaldehyde dehydrogenase